MVKSSRHGHVTHARTEREEQTTGRDVMRAAVLSLVRSPRCRQSEYHFACLGKSGNAIKVAERHPKRSPWKDREREGARERESRLQSWSSPESTKKSWSRSNWVTHPSTLAKMIFSISSFGKCNLCVSWEAISNQNMYKRLVCFVEVVSHKHDIY